MSEPALTRVHTRAGRALRLTIVVVAAALSLPLTGCGDRITANPKSAEKPTLIWYYYNPLTTLQNNWQTQDIKTSPQKVDISKGVVISGTGIAGAGMQSSTMSVEIYGECAGLDHGWIMTSGFGHQYLGKTATDKPPVRDGKADIGAGAIMQFKSAELKDYFTTGVDCPLWGLQGQPITGKRKAVRLRFSANVTTVANVTTQEYFVLNK